MTMPDLAWAGLGAALFAAAPATPPAQPAPVCMAASHDRLLVQKGRDVCAPALSARGEPRATGFLPTRCAETAGPLRIDAAGERDLCPAPRAQTLRIVR